MEILSYMIQATAVQYFLNIVSLNLTNDDSNPMRFVLAIHRTI